MGSPPSLIQLPDELLDCIITQVESSADTVHFGLTCKRVHSIVSPSLVWRWHCLTTWRYWAPRHDFAAKLTQPPYHTNWLRLYGDRMQTDRAASGLFEALLLTQQERVQRMQEIAAKGKDVQDLLLKFKDETPDDAEDVLARRWHAEAILGLIHRTTALDIWSRVVQDEDVSLEEALCGFDLFLLAVDRTDLIEDVKAELDRIAACVRNSTINFAGLSIRQKAVRIAEYMINVEGLFGNADPQNYDELRNNFISLFLFDKQHTALPQQSVAVYCAVSKRLGLDARPCGGPLQMLALVTAPPGQTLDGGPESTSDGPQHMYMNPYRRSQEVTLDGLRILPINADRNPARYAKYVNGIKTLDVCHQIARDLPGSVARARFAQPSPLDDVAAEYSSAWFMFMMGYRVTAFPAPPWRARQVSLVEQLRTNFPQDSVLIAQHMLPMIEADSEFDSTLEVIEYLQGEDRAQRVQKPRGIQGSQVRYQIGHYFQHKSYAYRGFIVGWDTHCAADSIWIARMGVDQLPHGREQPFYNILAHDKSSRYVAEENIKLLNERPDHEIMHLAGRFFKRWDENEKRFVSNIRDEYPDN